VIVPGITFGALYLWPFLEARFTGDHGPHHLLDRPRDHPVRTATGVGALSFFVLLQLAASNDLLAHWTGASVASITWTFRILVPLLPPVIGYVTYRLMTALQASGRKRLADLPLREALRSAVPEEPEVSEQEAGLLYVEPEPGGRWRWRYVEADNDVELCSNETFASADEARESGRRAYPGTPVSYSTATKVEHRSPLS
jgi:ubiquinol-cytochrome c reductase cytochrome b subunit